MGRKAGVTADQTRSELLAAAAKVFAAKGYDGASIADITTAAGLSSGSIYAHYDGKAELFIETVKAHARSEFARLIGVDEIADLSRTRSTRGVADFVTIAGTAYGKAGAFRAPLLVEAIVASKRHPEIAALVQSWMTEGESVFAAVVEKAQADGHIVEDLDAAALARFITMVALGARLTGALELPDVAEEGWAKLIGRLVDSARVGHDT